MATKRIPRRRPGQTPTPNSLPPPEGAPLLADPGAYWGSAAGLARDIAKEFEEAASLLLGREKSDREKDAAAHRIFEVSALMLGRRVDQPRAVSISFVRSIERAIEHLEVDRSEEKSREWLAKLPDDQRRDMEAFFETDRIWAQTTGAGEHARWWFARQYPDHARKLAVSDMDLAVAAVRGETGAKWEILATIIRERLRLAVAAPSLQTYLKKHRRTVRTR